MTSDLLPGYFITGTDTAVGKTWSTVALIHYFRRQGKVVAAMKPVASGCEMMDGALKNEDALLLQKHATINLPYATINPYAFEPAVSPHIAAAQAGEVIVFEKIHTCFKDLHARSDLVLVEGVGGWHVPLNQQEDVADLAISLKLPVILVVAIRLGCINHARLTLNAILSSDVDCAGWIASCTEADMLFQEENIDTLKQILNASLLGVLPFSDKPSFDDFAEKLNLENL